MKIKKIKILGVGGIDELELNFNDNFNIICGPNGIGKTTILECVAHTFSIHQTNVLKRNVSKSSGQVYAEIEAEGRREVANIGIANFEPMEWSNFSGLHQYSKNLLSIKASRAFQYQNIDAVRKDEVKGQGHTFEEAKNGVNSHEVKSWFINRYLYSVHEGALTLEQLSNLALAKESFSVLNPEFKFSHVVAASNEIMIATPSGVIYYEYLSSGFKSCLSIIFSIIKEIEFRFKDPTIEAGDFDGIIIIDELELHLHPEWQGKVANILAKIFPNVQFIAATHSPHVIQAARPDEVIALANESGEISRRNFFSGKYGFQGWTIEEVLTDVMGMPDTRTETYHLAMGDFEKSIELEDGESAQLAYEKLDELLHPNNYVRKLLRLELARVREKFSD